MFARSIFFAGTFLFIMCVSLPQAAEIAADSSPKLARLRKAAESGNAMDQYKYADELAWSGMHRKLAVEWYEKAAAQGNPYARASLISQQLADARAGSREAEALEKKLCPQLEKTIEELGKDDSAEAAYALGDIYISGICVSEGEKKGIEYLQKAAKEHHDKAQFMLANEYRRENDPDGRFVGLYEKAFKNGLPIAGIELAACYFEGKGTEKSEARANGIVKQVLALDDNDAKGILGLMFYRGYKGFPEDRERGEKLLRESAARGNAKAAGFLQKIDAKKEK